MFWNSLLTKPRNQPPTWSQINYSVTGQERLCLGAVSVDNRPVRFFPVDHSIPGACGYALETSAGWLAYTGDLRMHGSAASNTEAFIQGLAGLRPRVLLC